MRDYKKYQFQWMLDHGYSLNDLMSELTKFQYDDPEDSDHISTPISKLFDEWVQDAGFGSEIWACEEEWKQGKPHEDSILLPLSQYERVNKLLSVSSIDDLTADERNALGARYHTHETIYHAVFDDGTSACFDLYSDKDNYWGEITMTGTNNEHIVIAAHRFMLGDIEFEVGSQTYMIKLAIDPNH